jgi:anti-sigma B factor antagonist
VSDILHIESSTAAGDVMIVAFRGELDMAGLESARTALSEAAQARPRILVVDLTGLEFMDSSGAGVLIGAHRRAAAAGQRLVVLNGSATPHRVLSVLGLDRHLEMIDDLAALDDGHAAAAEAEVRGTTGPTSGT